MINVPTELAPSEGYKREPLPYLSLASGGSPEIFGNLWMWQPHLNIHKAFLCNCLYTNVPFIFCTLVTLDIGLH